MKDIKIEDQTGGELTDTPNDKYKKFFEKFSEIDGLDVAAFKPVHLIGYFTRKFKAASGSEYKFKFNSPSPSKCFEVFQIKKLSQMLSSKPNILKEYIDWIFVEKVEKEGKKFRSISFLTSEDIVREYKMKVLMNDRLIDRTTMLPADIILFFSPLGSKIGAVTTYGDLAFYNKALANEEWWQQEMAMAKKCHPNFDFSILEKVK